MPLVSGTKLGPYEILALIGAGGMGEVYRAQDGRLKRDVALKVCRRPSSTTHNAWLGLNEKHSCWQPSIIPTSAQFMARCGKTLLRRKQCAFGHRRESGL